MEKLVELLNEYEVERKDGGKWDILDVAIVEKLRCLAISKSYGFIKWLVENDKIDYQKSPGEIMFDDRMGTTFSLEDSIIMMLSISDTPIEDLCGYLKDDATEKVDTLLKGIKKSCESLGI